MAPKKKNRNNVIETEEVATDFKLQQFLEDVQKFTEKSKKHDKKQVKSKKTYDGGPQAHHKRGLFENGFRSKPFLKENKARLKSNLNDLVKECAKTPENEKETSPSSSQSIFEDSYELGNKEADNNKNDNVVGNEKRNNGNEKAADESERPHNTEAPHRDHNSPTTIIKDTEKLKELLWEKYCERLDRVPTVTSNLSLSDQVKIAQRKIQLAAYRNFLLHARQYPTVLRRIFSSDEIKKLAKVVVNDKADKCVQTDDVKISSPVNNNVQFEKSTKKDSLLSFPHSSQNSCDKQEDKGNFFDLNVPKKIDTRVNFLESLENQPDIYSPGVQNISPECNVTPPSSPLPVNIRQCWAPSTLSSPRKPEIFSPSISPPIHRGFQKPIISPLEPAVINKANLRRSQRRKKTSQLKFMQNMNTPDSPQLCFPKRKKMAYSPHRL